MNKKRLFVDMDGTLTTFKYEAMEKLEEKGYFKNLEPHKNVVYAIKNIIENEKDIDVYILSAVLNTPYAKAEKNEWLDNYLPEIPQDKRIFAQCGVDKREFIEGGVCINDTLLDDYTLNLNKWDKTGTAIKLDNDINGTNGTWKGPRVDYLDNNISLTNSIVDLINENYIEITSTHIQFIKDNHIVDTYQEYLLLQDINEYSKEYINVLNADKKQIEFEITDKGLAFINSFEEIQIQKGYTLDDDFEVEDDEMEL